MEIEKESEQFMLYLKDYLELWPHFCWHNDNNPKVITDRVLFKEEFTFENWKKGKWKWNYTDNYQTLYRICDNIDGIKLKDNYLRITWNQYRFKPFNIRYELDS
jgi:hypothetical protein